MARGLRQDIICAGVIAVLLHGIVIFLPFPEWWRVHPYDGESREVITVSLYTPRTVSFKSSSSRSAETITKRQSSRDVKRGLETVPPRASVGAGEDFPAANLSAENDPIAGQYDITAVPAVVYEEESSSSGTVLEMDFTPPHYLHNPAPLYPVLARQSGFEGVSVISADVQADGRVISVRVKRSSGYDILDEAARTAVKEWVFEPARKNGLPVECFVDIPVRFALQDG